MISAQEVWNSLYTDKVESIWKSERAALRKPAMIYYVLTQELQKFQDNLADEMKQFEHQILSMEEHESNEKRENVAMPLSENELSKSPTINKHRNISFNRRIPKLNLNLSKQNLLLRKENLDVDIIESSSPEVSFNQKKLKEGNKLFTPNNVDMVDSSFIIENTPVKSVIKKANRKVMKRNLKKDKSSTLTQLFKTIPTSNSISNNTRLFNQTSPDCKKLDNKSKDVSVDETFYDVKMETNTTSTKSMKNVFKDYDYKTSPNCKKLDNKSKDVSADETFCDVKMETTSTTSTKSIKNAFKDYDKFPIARPKSPLFVHKTEPVRRKADRMQLPGWSCENCRKFYESLNLPPEVLREKMNACSRHRNKFEPLDETFEGYWDLKMFPTQDI